MYIYHGLYSVYVSLKLYIYLCIYFALWPLAAVAVCHLVRVALSGRLAAALKIFLDFPQILKC